MTFKTDVVVNNMLLTVIANTRAKFSVCGLQ